MAVVGEGNATLLAAPSRPLPASGDRARRVRLGRALRRGALRWCDAGAVRLAGEVCLDSGVYESSDDESLPMAPSVAAELDDERALQLEQEIEAERAAAVDAAVVAVWEADDAARAAAEAAEEAASFCV